MFIFHTTRPKLILNHSDLMPHTAQRFTFHFCQTISLFIHPLRLFNKCCNLNFVLVPVLKLLILKIIVLMGDKRLVSNKLMTTWIVFFWKTETLPTVIQLATFWHYHLQIKSSTDTLTNCPEQFRNNCWLTKNTYFPRK